MCFTKTADNGKIKKIVCLTEKITAYKLAEFEITVEGAVGNAFDPDSLRLDFTYSSPDGKTHTHPCFIYRKVNIDENGVYTLDPAAEPVWRARITPTLHGKYSGEIALF